MRVARSRRGSLSTSAATLLAALSIGLTLGGCASHRISLEEAPVPVPTYTAVQAPAQAPAADDAAFETHPVEAPAAAQALAGQPDEAQAQAQVRAPEVDMASIEKVPFRIGVSSITVEKLARDFACTGGEGAGLVTTPGPVEVYRMQCDGGKVFVARCEMRQCKAL